MSEKTNIEWTNHTGNPWIGCTKVSPGCKNCYAATLDENRFSRTMGGGTKEKPVSHWGKGAPRFRTKAFWNDAKKWNRNAQGASQRPRVFPSLCDWLDEEVPIEWLADFLKLIHDTPNLDWLLLTKRPEKWADRLCAAMQWVDRDWLKGRGERPELGNWIGGWLEGVAPGRGMAAVPRNIWIGVSVEDQHRADERIPKLLTIPAQVRFLSVEPLLDAVDLELGARSFGFPKHITATGLAVGMPQGIHWVIVGGESGPDRRDCGVEAIISVAEQCQAAGVPCFVKQDCAAQPGQQGRISHSIWALKQFPNIKP